MPSQEEQNAVQTILNTHPLKFHFDSQETYFPIDERKNNIEFLFRKYNYLKDHKGKSKSDEQFCQMMQEFHIEFDQIAVAGTGDFVDLGHEPNLDKMNLYIHNWSLKNLLQQEGNDTIKTLKAGLEQEFPNKDIKDFNRDDLKKLYSSGLKFVIEGIDLKDNALTPKNLLSCNALTDKVAKGQDITIPFEKHVNNSAPLYYNLQKSTDGKKFVMQFGLTYPVNDGMSFPKWIQPAIKMFVATAKRFSPKLFGQIKGTENGKIGFHLEDRELGHYEGKIENGQYIVEKVALTGHGPKAFEVQEIGTRKEVDVYVGVGGHPNYFRPIKFLGTKIGRMLEEVPIVGLIPLVKRMALNHGDHSDAKGETLTFQGDSKNLRNWQEDSILRNSVGSGAPTAIVHQRLFFSSYENFEQKTKVASKQEVIFERKYHTQKHSRFFSAQDIPKMYKSEKVAERDVAEKSEPKPVSPKAKQTPSIQVQKAQDKKQSASQLFSIKSKLDHGASSYSKIARQTTGGQSISGP